MITEEQKKLITEIFNRPLPYKHAGVDVHLQSHETEFSTYNKYNPKHLYRFQSPGIKVDKTGRKRKVKNTYDVEIYHYDNKPLSTKDTSQHGEVIFRKKNRQSGDKGDVTATGDSGKMSPHVFSTVLHIAHNHAKRHDLTHLRFSASNKEPSRVSLYKTASERYGGGMIPPDGFEKRVKSELPAQARERGLRGDYLHRSLDPSVPFRGRTQTTKQDRINAIGWAENLPRSAGRNAMQRLAVWRAATGSTEFKIPVKGNKNERAANLGKQGPENEEESKRIETRMKDIHAKANIGAPKSRNGWERDDMYESINNILNEKLDLLKKYITLSEARIKIVKVRIRRGKIQRRKKVSNVKGYTMRGGKLTRMSTRERMKRKIGQRRGKLKRKAKKAKMLIARKRALRKRTALGL